MRTRASFVRDEGAPVRIDDKVRRVDGEAREIRRAREGAERNCGRTRRRLRARRPAYRAPTGRPPFGVQDVQALLDVVYRQPTAPSDVLSDLPHDVELVLAIALAKKPGDRFATARARVSGRGPARRR
jgi:hypothetical protein